MNIVKGLKFICGRVTSNRYYKNIFFAFRAGFLARLIPFLVAPVLARIFSPEEFAIYSLIVSISVFCSGLSVLKVDWSIPNAKGFRQARALSMVGIICSILLFVVLFFLCYIGFFDDSNLEIIKALSPYKWMILMVILGMSLQHVLQGWYVREANLETVSNSKIIQSGVNVFGQISFGFANFGVTSLALSLVFSYWISLAFLKKAVKEIFKKTKKIIFTEILLVCRIFGKEMITSVMVFSINSLSLAALPLLLFLFYQPEELGWYALMHRLAVVPMGFLTTAVSQSFWAEAAKRVKSEPESLYRLYIKSTKILMVICVPLIGIWLCSPFYVGIILGEQWGVAANVLITLIPMLAAQLVVSPLSHLIVHGRQHWQLLWDLVRCFLVIMVVMVMGSNEINFLLTILMVSLIHFFFYTALFFINIKAIRLNND